MLLFSTVLSINNYMTKDDFVKLVIQWNNTNPRVQNVIPGVVWTGERNFRYGDDELWLEVREYRKRNIIAVRYQKIQEKGIIWDTDYVMDFDSGRMSIRLERSYTQDAPFADPDFSTPHFISLLIEHRYIKDDKDLPVLRAPDIIAADRLELLAGIINGDLHYDLPVVFVSKTFAWGSDPVNVELMAGRLKGVAHVLVLENAEMGAELRELTDSRNEFNGAVGVYFPNPNMANKWYLYRRDSGFDDNLMEQVIRTVIRYCSTQTVDTLLTWHGVMNAMLVDDLELQRGAWQAAEAARKNAESETEKLRESFDAEEKRIHEEAAKLAKEEADDLLDSFDEDMQRLQKQIEDLTNTNEVLAFENQVLKNRLDSADAEPVIYMGDEYALYSGEVKDMILSVLSDALPGIEQGTRRYDVIKDIIDSNDYQELSRGKAEELKRILNGYDRMTSRVRQQLMDLGFEITDDGKHYKVIYYGDRRYNSALSKTPSDVRTGKNSAQELIKKVF